MLVAGGVCDEAVGRLFGGEYEVARKIDGKESLEKVTVSLQKDNAKFNDRANLLIRNLAPTVK